MESNPPFGVLFERAVARGEITPQGNAALATEMLVAPLYFRLLITDAPLDDAFAERVAALVLHGVQG